MPAILAVAIRDRLGRAWGATRRWFAANTFTPRWAPQRLRPPAAGYLVAILLQIVAVAFMLFLVQRLGAFLFQDALELLAIALVALNWGAGPSVAATVFGALLINYVVLTPHFAFSGPREAVGLVIFVAVGIAISVVASQTERERRAGIALAARLATEQARLEAIIESAPDMISIHDAEGTLVRRNRTAQQVAPHARGDERLDEAQQAYALYTLDDHPLATDELPVARALRGEAIQNLEVLARLPDGDRILSVSAAAVRDAWGAILGAVAITHDVTPLRRSERQAAERAAQLEATFEALVDGVVVFDPAARLTYMNGALRRLIGIDAAPSYYDLPLDERMTRLQMRDLRGEPLPPERSPQRRVLGGEVLVGLEADDYLLHTLDGREVRININGAPMRDEHEAIAGGVLILRDVTEQRRLETRTHEALLALLTVATTLVETPAEAQAQEQGARILAQRLIDLTRSVLGCRRVSISVRNPSTDTLHALAVVGLSSAQERHWWAEQEEQEREGIRFGDGPDQEVVARLRAGEVITFDLTRPPYDALPNPYSIRTVLVAPMCIADTLVGLLSYDYGGEEHDYSAPELLVAGGVARLVALVLERERLLREAAEARGRELALERANARMDEFLGIASHELRTPLTTIKANVQLTDRRVRQLDPAAGDLAEQLRRVLPVRELMERTQRQVDRLDRLVGDLLDISRIRAGKLELRLEPSDLAALVRDVVREQCLAWPGRQITLALSEGPVPVEADPDRIGQVVTNYLTNALKYSPDEAPVQVVLAVERDATGATELARVAVRDAGPGLPPEEHELVWERFHRVPGIEVQSGSGVGLGLGLHISREIVERHGGAVGVASAVGQGSTFWFTLPLAPP